MKVSLHISCPQLEVTFPLYFFLVKAKCNMGQDSKIREFPDISSKLTAPTKKSVFERQKAEAEAKRQREQEETAAVYEDFVKSFDNEDEKSPSATPTGGYGAGPGGARGGGAFGVPSKRHFSGPPAGRGGFASRANSGPGSLGPPPPSFSRKRGYDGTPATQSEQASGLFAFEDAATGPPDAKAAFQESDEEDNAGPPRPHERAPPKPTLRMSSLPPGTSPAVIKSFIPANLNIEGIRILPPSGPGTMDRRSLSAVVTLAKETPTLDIDTAVSALQNRYMGRGFYLTLSRHLSSTALDTEPPLLGLSSTSSSLPFGARPIPSGPGAGLGRGVGGAHRGGFAPPQSYAPSAPGQLGRKAPPVQVNVNPPNDLNQLKMIHKTLEALLTHGPEFEALLMSRRDVQMGERWAWLWDSRSEGGVYYRWRLWDILTGASQQNRGGRRAFQPSRTIFEGGAAWAPPELGLQFEYTTKIEQFVSDSDYNSSDEDDSGDEGRRRYYQHHGGAPPPDANADNDGQAYLNPLQKAKLTHLLARLPNTNAKLRKGDVARVTAFAIQHASEGAEEVVQMITSNVLKPYNFTGANPDYKPGDQAAPRDNRETPAEDDNKPATEQEDTSPSKLIALYLISDILSSSSTSGVRHAWRYRQLFESSLKTHQVFEHLGRLEKILHWGRLRAEKWKRSVGSVLALWEGWCVFPQASQEHFSAVFEKPPLTPREKEEKAQEAEREKEKGGKGARWKTVEEKAQEREAEEQERRGEETMMEDVDGERMMDEDLDGEPMEEDDDDDNLDGEPMVEDDQPPDPHPEPVQKSPDPAPPAPAAASEDRDRKDHPSSPPPKRRRRPKAEDMFADSD